VKIIKTIFQDVKVVNWEKTLKNDFIRAKRSWKKS